MQKYNTRRKQYYTLCFLIISPLLALCFHTSCSGDPQGTLERIADETKMSLPQIIDEYTTMVDCESMPEKTLKLTYATKNVQYNSAQRVNMEKAMKGILIQRLKERKELEFYLVNNVRFEHVFLGADRKEIMHVNIEPLDYK